MSSSPPQPSIPIYNPIAPPIYSSVPLPNLTPSFHISHAPLNNFPIPLTFHLLENFVSSLVAENETPLVLGQVAPNSKNDNLITIRNYLVKKLLPQVELSNPLQLPTAGTSPPISFVNVVKSSIITPSPTIPISQDGERSAISVSKVVASTCSSSLSFALMGRFFGKRPSLEWVEDSIKSSWNLSMPCLVSLKDKVSFYFFLAIKQTFAKLYLLTHRPLVKGQSI